MDTKKLRQKILDLAIRGKLVPQDPNDEPASVLLERIRAEKERFIKEGKIKRSKKSATDDEIEAPFEIPESWEWVRIEDFVMAVTDGDHQPPPQSATGVPFLVISDVNTGDIDFSRARFVSEEYYQSLPTIRKATKGDILFTVTGSYGIPILVETEQRFCFQRHIGLVKTISCSEWITYYLQSPYVQKYCDKVATGTAQKTVSLGHLRDLVIPVPSLSEQKRIVNEVERWFALIDELESNEGDLLKAIDQAKSKILDLAIHGKLVPQDPNDESAIDLLKRINPKFEACENAQDQFEVPNNWVWITIDDVCEVARGGSPRPIKDYLTDTNDGINWIKIGDAEKNGKYINSAKERIKPEGKRKSRYVHKGDFLLTNSMSFGHPYILNIDGCIHDGWLVISPLENAFKTDFLYHLLSSVFVYDQFSEAASGGVVSNLNSEKVAKTIVPLPPYSEQLRIVAKIEELYAVLDCIKESLD